jgi:hypothetical protein
LDQDYIEREKPASEEEFQYREVSVLSETDVQSIAINANLEGIEDIKDGLP